jgi:hypothetical protein
MSSNTAVEGQFQASDAEAGAVHAWRVSQLIRLGLDWQVAEVIADTIDWHDVAKLVRLGCPAALAVAIVG